MIVKTYLTLAQTRALAADHPVGDPTGGPAYREARAPAAAIIGMATSFSGMAAGSIMAGLAFAGSALSLVGTLTGNKTLSTIGMAAGAIGGAGMAGLFGETAQAATWGSTFGASGAEAGASAASSGLSQSAAAAPGNLAPVVEGAQAFPVAPPGDVSMAALPDIGGGTIASMPQAASPAALNAPGGAGLNVPGTGASLGGSAAAPLGQTAAPGAGIPGTGAGEGIAAPAAGESGGLIGNVMSAAKGVGGIIKDNPELAKILAQGAGGLAHYLSGVPDAQLDALQSQVGMNDARAMQIQEQIQLEKDRRARLNAGYQQVDQSIRVNPNVNMTQHQPMAVRGGLIAGAMGQ